MSRVLIASPSANSQLLLLMRLLLCSWEGGGPWSVSDQGPPLG